MFHDYIVVHRRNLIVNHSSLSDYKAVRIMCVCNSIISHACACNIYIRQHYYIYHTVVNFINGTSSLKPEHVYVCMYVCVCGHHTMSLIRSTQTKECSK